MAYSENTRVLIIGVGSIGERHLRCFDNTGRVELSICEVNDALRGKIAKQYDPQESFVDLDAALENPPDAAVIGAPAHLHIPMAIQLAEAGVHLLIEKPLSTSEDGIDRLRSLIEERGLSTAVAYTTRMNPLLREMRREIQSGRFGKPVQLMFNSGQHFPFYRPAYRETYYTDRATGGGAIQDALTHGINSSEWLLGPVTEVAADAAHQVLEGVDVEDTVHVIARHDSVLANYCMNQHQAPNETTITVNCERGTVRCEFHRQRWLWQTEPDAEWTEAAHQPHERDDLFVAQAHMFLDVMEGKAVPTCSLEGGLQTMRVNLAILQAVETKTWQKVG